MSKCLICNIPQEIINQLNVEYSYLHEEDLATEMKDLVLMTSHEMRPLSVQEAFVYLYDYSEDEMRKISETLKKNGITAVLAAATSHNLLWTFSTLLNEVMTEHRTFQSAAYLKELIQKSVKRPIDKDQKKVEKILMESFVAFQNKDLEQMQKMIVLLEELNQ